MGAAGGPMDLVALAQTTRLASQELARSSGASRNRALEELARYLEARWDELLGINQEEWRQAQRSGLDPARLDRLKLPSSPQAFLEGLHQLVLWPDPLGSIEELQLRPNGLQVGRMRVPLGTLGFIYEARPGATLEASSLAIKTGNALLLRGGREAYQTNSALVQGIQEALKAAGLPPQAVQLVPPGDRQEIVAMCHLSELDLLIPRGGRELIELVRKKARMPVLAHAEGVNHLYIDAEADREMAIALAVNGKTQRPATCNALEKILLHRSRVQDLLYPLAEALQHAGAQLRGDPEVAQLLGIPEASEEEWGLEYLDLRLTLRLVGSLEEAIAHISRYGSHHTEVICTQNYTHALRFLREVDASVVLVNASSRFNDGFQLGLGAEIGISTQKFHAYGPMGVRELTASKWVVLGNGQIRT